MKNILLVGAHGFAGKRFCNLTSGLFDKIYKLVHQRHNFAEADTFTTSQIHTTKFRQVISEIDTVLYMASSTTPGTSIRHPVKEIDNISFLLKLMEILQNVKPVHIIYISSGGTVYGEGMAEPITEATECKPISYYGAIKLASENLLNIFHNTTQAPVSILRPSNFYGPGQTYKEGFGIIRTVMQKIIDGDTLEIWGDGSSKRDFIFIDDFVHACVKTISQNHNEAGYHIYNIGSSKGTTINELCQLIETVTGKPLKKVYRQKRNSDVKDIILDCSKIKGRLGWEPETSLTTGLEKTWSWLIL